MRQLIFRHISGSRATEIDVVDLNAHHELILGRASSAAVRFDPRKDAGVGRHHARIVWNSDRPRYLLLTDLGSRNGTFVNQERVGHPVVLHAGDVVQLGAKGPEVEVRWEMMG